MNIYSIHFSLKSFEGPLDILLSLIQKNEIDIHEISLFELVNQCLQELYKQQKEKLNLGAEFVGTVAYFLFLKSQMLLPKQELETVSLEEDPQFEMIYHLIDYCKFKESSKELSQLYTNQLNHYYRPKLPEKNLPRSTGVEHLCAEDLKTLFQSLLAKKNFSPAPIEEEPWKVSDKIKAIKKIFQKTEKCSLNDFFAGNKSRLEMIVTFLALLELMKIGEIRVEKERKEEKVMVIKKRENRS
mgnify:CR=1 FL=1